MGSDDIKKKEILANKAKRLKKKNQKNKSDDVSRRGDQLPEIPKILILTEGTSEVYYFESLIKMLRLSNLVDVEESDYTVVTRKPIIAGAEELEYNKRARSAKLRIIERD